MLDFIIVVRHETAYRGMGPGRQVRLDLADIQAISQQISGIRIISAERNAGNGTITYQEKNSNAQIGGSLTSTSG